MHIIPSPITILILHLMSEDRRIERDNCPYVPHVANFRLCPQDTHSLTHTRVAH